MRHALGTLGVALVLGLVVLPGPWGGTPLPPVGALAPTVAGDPIRGAALASALDCIRCHAEPRTGHGANIPPSLRVAGSRSRGDWLVRYLVDPHDLRYISQDRRPRIRMPRALTEASDARDLAAYLSTLRDTALVRFVPNAETWAEDSTLVSSGQRLFDQYQCRGCHVLQGHGNRIGPALDAVGDRRLASYILGLLQDPQRVIPGTAMEDKRLWDEEAKALTAFLSTLRDTQPPVPQAPR